MEQDKEQIIPQWILDMIDRYYNRPERKLLMMFKKKGFVKPKGGMNGYKAFDK